jgi:hypothetical protein
MRKLLFVALLVVATVAACDTKDPAGPANVTITGPSPFTTTTTTSVATTVPPTTVPPTTTSTIPFSLSRTYISLGVVPPNIPNSLTLTLRQLSGGVVASSWREYVPFLSTAADPVFNVLGFYTTSGGGSGAVQGRLVGTLDAGTFEGTLTSVTAECTAEREFFGGVNAQSLQWTGGTTLKDCKGNPLSFSSLTMLATTAPPPVTPPVPVTTTIPLICAYGLSSGAASFNINGGSVSVALSTGPTCGWTVQRFVDWVTVQPTAGSGPSSISIVVSANPGAPRSTTVVIAGQQFLITQSNVSTTTTVSSSSTTSTTTTTTTIPVLDME